MNKVHSPDKYKIERVHHSWFIIPWLWLTFNACSLAICSPRHKNDSYGYGEAAINFVIKTHRHTVISINIKVCECVRHLQPSSLTEANCEASLRLAEYEAWKFPLRGKAEKIFLKMEKARISFKAGKVASLLNHVSIYHLSPYIISIDQKNALKFNKKRRQEQSLL